LPLPFASAGEPGVLPVFRDPDFAVPLPRIGEPDFGVPVPWTPGDVPGAVQLAWRPTIRPASGLAARSERPGSVGLTVTEQPGSELVAWWCPVIAGAENR
jgi:uncharacterized protein YcsI (UPF0317 family)